jgi:hypothetical protein
MNKKQGSLWRITRFGFRAQHFFGECVWNEYVRIYVPKSRHNPQGSLFINVAKNGPPNTISRDSDSLFTRVFYEGSSSWGGTKKMKGKRVFPFQIPL